MDLIDNTPKKDVLESWTLFPTNIYSIKKLNFLELVDDISSEYLSKKEKTVNEIKTGTFQSNNFFNDNRLSEFISYVADTAWNILNLQGYDMSRMATTYTEMWAQECYKKSQMPQHVHGYNSQISGFYFLECPKDCARILVHDARPGKVQINLPQKDEASFSEGSTMFNFVPEEGQLVFFNSWLPHSFTQHDSDYPLKLVHFNLNVITHVVTDSSAIIV
jgi:uncharacterized protein (TIGR02466 family)